MTDVVSLLAIVAFFALAAVYVKACEAILGPDRTVPADGSDSEPERLAA